jgi:2-amino-4-hydroxy-6-hydroxymethyldihydropteridine diphosphokinase
MLNDNIALLSIGSNLGNKELYINNSIDAIQKNPYINLLKVSKFIETDPLEVVDQPNFLNAIIKISTSLTPLVLLDYLQELEIKLGRVKRYDKGPREIDIDILTYGNQIFSDERLTIPHHSLYSRSFIKDILNSISELSIYETLNKGNIDENNYSIFSK